MGFFGRLFGWEKSHFGARPNANPFGCVWRYDPGPMVLLNMGGENLQAVLRSIAEAFESRDDCPRFIHLMLQQPDWRSHLVAAVAALLSTDRSRYAPALWAAFDSGSWVAPQLACTLYYADTDFAAEAKRRITAGCPVSAPAGLSAVERHIFTGPAGGSQRSAKNLASLLQVLQRLPGEAPWVATELDKSEVQELLRTDIDRSAKIAESWFEDLRASFATMGRDLNRLTD